MTDRTIFLLPVICILACFMTLWLDTQNMPSKKLKTKLLASLAFIGFAWNLGANDSLYGQFLFAGLVFSMIGDVLLAIQGKKRWFALGIGAFLLSHLLYAVAFSTLGVVTTSLPLVLPVILVAVLAFGLWLRPHLTGVFKVAVPAYLIAIGGMLILAWLVPNGPIQFWVIAGASLFALSDVFVARNRFIESAFINRAIGLPLYYLAQLLLAYSIAKVPLF